MSEIEEIKERYKRRKETNSSASSFYAHFIRCEREFKYLRILEKKFSDKASIKLLEVGAGSGDNLLGFKRMGLSWNNLTANELIEDRFVLLKNNVKTEKLLLGDASNLDFYEEFDVVFQSTVFTSILDDDLKFRLAKKLFDMTKAGGMVLWYDFKYNNPSNSDVKGVGKKEITKLFPSAKKLEFHSVTLAPPIGRRLGALYGVVNGLMPFLRTHIVAAIYK